MALDWALGAAKLYSYFHYSQYFFTIGELISHSMLFSNVIPIILVRARILYLRAETVYQVASVHPGFNFSMSRFTIAKFACRCQCVARIGVSIPWAVEITTTLELASTGIFC